MYLFFIILVIAMLQIVKYQQVKSIASVRETICHLILFDYFEMCLE